MIPWPDYTSSHDNELGLGEHMQGIQRIKQHLIVTGAVKTGIRKSQFIIIKMGSQSALQPWSLPKYGYPYKKPDERDRIVKVFDVDRSLWHAGGIQAVGDVVAIPIYGSDKTKPGSEVRFFNFDNPESPKELTSITLIKPDIESKAIAMTRTPDNHYVLMVWDDKVLDFHRSNTTVITEGFSETPVRVRKSEVIGGFQLGGGGQSGEGTYQSLNFVRDTNETFYLVATRNQEKASPTFHGKDLMDLYKVWWPDGFGGKVQIKFVKQKQMYCYNQQANFGAGSGIYVQDERHMFLYAASHWLHGGNKRYNFSEYAYSLDTPTD